MRRSRGVFWPVRFRFGAWLRSMPPREVIGHGIAPDLWANVKATLVDLDPGQRPTEEANSG
jgi:hypothetical protein